jgi:hypothetical protein
MIYIHVEKFAVIYGEDVVYHFFIEEIKKTDFIHGLHVQLKLNFYNVYLIICFLNQKKHLFSTLHFKAACLQMSQYITRKSVLRKMC